jgi:hypothetical protein
MTPRPITILSNKPQLQQPLTAQPAEINPIEMMVWGIQGSLERLYNEFSLLSLRACDDSEPCRFLRHLQAFSLNVLMQSIWLLLNRVNLFSNCTRLGCILTHAPFLAKIHFPNLSVLFLFALLSHCKLGKE